MKLTGEKYEEYLFLSRDGVVARKRNLDVCREWAEHREQEQGMLARATRIRTDGNLVRPFPEIPAVTEWLATFKEDRLRYPLLIVHGPSLSGKTEYAKSLFNGKHHEMKMGEIEHFPDSMRKFDRKIHTGIVMDDVRDLAFLKRHQDKIQGKYDSLVEFGSTPSGQHAYSKDLFAVPIVITVNNDTANLQFLITDDFLGNEGNRVVIRFPPPMAAPP